MKKWLTIFVFSIFHILVVSGFIVPDEIPTALSIIYSNIPKIKLGSDSRLGWGFRIGDRADAQVVLELGPQKYTQPLYEVNSDDELLISKRNSRFSRLRNERKRGAQEIEKSTERPKITTETVTRNLDRNQIEQNVLRSLLAQLRTTNSSKGERGRHNKPIEIGKQDSNHKMGSSAKKQRESSIIKQKINVTETVKNKPKLAINRKTNNSVTGILSNILTRVRTFVKNGNISPKHTNVPTNRNQIQSYTRRTQPSPRKQNSRVKIQNTPINLLHKLKEKGVGILKNIIQTIEEKKKALYSTQRKPTTQTPKRGTPKPSNKPRITVKPSIRPQTNHRLRSKTSKHTAKNETEPSRIKPLMIETNRGFIEIVENRIREIMKEAEKKSLSVESRMRINKEIDDIQQLLVVLKNNAVKDKENLKSESVEKKHELTQKPSKQAVDNEMQTSGIKSEKLETSTGFVEIVENRIREIMKEAEKKSLSKEARIRINKEIDDIQQLLVVLKSNAVKDKENVKDQSVETKQELTQKPSKQTADNETKPSEIKTEKLETSSGFVEVVENRIREIMKEVEKKSLSKEARIRINKEIVDIQQLLVVLNNNADGDKQNMKDQSVEDKNLNGVNKEKILKTINIPKDANKNEIYHVEVANQDCSKTSCIMNNEKNGDENKIVNQMKKKQKLDNNPGIIRKKGRKQINSRKPSNGLSNEVISLLTSLWYPQTHRNILKNTG